MLANPRTFTAAGVVAALLVIGGAFLTWAKATAPAIPTVTQPGIESDGVVTLPLALVAVGVLAWRRRRKGQELRQGLILLAIGALIALIALIGILDVERIASKLREQSRGGIEYGAGPGLYLTLAGGGAIAALGALASSFARRPPGEPRAKPARPTKRR